MRTHSSRHRKASRPVQWVVDSSGAFGFAAGYLPASYTALVNATVTGVSLLEATNADNPLAIDRFTVMRIKGDLIFNNVSSSASVGLIGVGICVVDVLNGTADKWDPHTAVEGPKSWMYLRHYYVSTTGAQQDTGVGDNQTCLPMGAHIDVKVKRILRPQQGLCLFMNVAAAAGTPAMNYTCALRTLVAHAI